MVRMIWTALNCEDFPNLEAFCGQGTKLFQGLQGVKNSATKVREVFRQNLDDSERYLKIKGENCSAMEVPAFTKTCNLTPIAALKDRKSCIKAIHTAKRVAFGKRATEAYAACKRSRAHKTLQMSAGQWVTAQVARLFAIPKANYHSKIQRFHLKAEISLKNSICRKDESCSRADEFNHESQA